MNDFTLKIICLAFGLSSAMISGVFLSFSDFIMKGFENSKAESSIDCMQELNKTVFGSIFLTIFLGLFPMTVGFAIYSKELIIVVAAIVYCISVFMVTIVCNVPMNKRLDNVGKSSQEAILYWRIYKWLWTRWNHVRTLGSFVTATLFLIAAI